MNLFRDQFWFSLWNMRPGFYLANLNRSHSYVFHTSMSLSVSVVLAMYLHVTPSIPAHSPLSLDFVECSEPPRYYRLKWTIKKRSDTSRLRHDQCHDHGCSRHFGLSLDSAYSTFVWALWGGHFVYLNLVWVDSPKVDNVRLHCTRWPVYLISRDTESCGLACTTCRYRRTIAYCKTHLCLQTFDPLWNLATEHFMPVSYCVHSLLCNHYIYNIVRCRDARSI